MWFIISVRGGRRRRRWHRTDDSERKIWDLILFDWFSCEHLDIRHIAKSFETGALYVALREWSGAYVLAYTATTMWPQKVLRLFVGFHHICHVLGLQYLISDSIFGFNNKFFSVLFVLSFITFISTLSSLFRLALSQHFSVSPSLFLFLSFPMYFHFLKYAWVKLYLNDLIKGCFVWDSSALSAHYCKRTIILSCSCLNDASPSLKLNCVRCFQRPSLSLTSINWVAWMHFNLNKFICWYFACAFLFVTVSISILWTESHEVCRLNDKNLPKILNYALGATLLLLYPYISDLCVLFKLIALSSTFEPMQIRASP